MGRILRREHESERSAFAALLTTGMLVAILVLAGLAAPSPAYAGELQGTGTAEDPMLIYNTGDLIAWCNKLNEMGQDQERQQHARLMNDLTVPGIDGTEYGGAVTNDVIAAMNHPDLQVTEFDGNGHLIELQLTGSSALFQTGGKPDDTGVTTIKDLHVIGSVSHGGSAGTLFGSIGEEGNPSENRRIEITDCTNQANVEGGPSAGGFIGSYYDNESGEGSIDIERCSNFGDILSSQGHAGGLVGSLVEYSSEFLASSHRSSLEYCSNNGAIKSMGGSFSTFYDVYEKDKPETIGGCAGGLVGYSSYKSTHFVIGHDYNQGEIYSASGIGYSGGLVGFSDTTTYDQHTISYCYNSGTIKTNAAEAGHAGGLFGFTLYHVNNPNGCQTLEGSVPADAVSGTNNGSIVSKINMAYGHGYTSKQVLEGVGVGKSIKVTVITPLSNKYDYEQVGWSKTFHGGDSYPPEGYRVLYWTREALDANGTWSEPPKEYKADSDDIHDRVYGGEPVFYAYCVPSSATVKFDLNEPTGGYTCSLDPKDATKTFMKGEPVGALPTATCVNPNDKKDTRAFLGWATKKDGNDPKAEWISENSDNLYDFRDDSHTITLYAQWADTSVPFEILRQPEDCLVSAVAEGVNHEVWFDFYTTYDYYSATLQFKKEGSSSYKDLDVPHAAMADQFHFYLESSTEAMGDYRIKIEYYDFLEPLGTLYTSSANIVLDIPQSEAKVSSITLEEDSEIDEVLGTHSYNVNGSILGDLPSLIDESVPGNFAHMAWIEGGLGGILPATTNTAKLYVDDVRGFTLADQNSREGQTYTLCVSRVMDNYYLLGRYTGESEPYRVPFVVPYADSVAASITAVQVTEEPVVQNGKALDFDTDYNVLVNGTFNLASDVQYTQAQTDGREVSAQWQYCIGSSGWTDVPDELFAQDEKGKPVRGIAWSDDRKSARLYATLNAQAKLDEAYFRVKLSTPPASVDTASAQSKKALNLSVPQPKITDLKVTNDTHVSVTWEWEDAAGNKLPSDGYYVSIERDDSSSSGEENWVEVNRGRVYTYTYDATLDPQQKYRVSVRADTEGLQSSSVQKEFSTSGTTVLAWDDTYCTAYLPSENKNDKISVDYDWASYKDGKHVALYTWHLSTEKYAETAYQKFFTTESDTASFPEDFRKAYDESAHPETLCDPMDAWWVWLEAEVYNLDEKGNPTYGITETIARTSALPVVHRTSETLSPSTKDVGSHSMTICWDAPAEGLVREYEVEVDDRIWIVPSEQAKDGHFELKVDGLPSDTWCDAGIGTTDSRIPTYTGSYTWIKNDTTLPSPEVGTWTATANPSDARQGDEITLSASYAANSGKFPKAAELQWYSWREGDKDWRPEGDPVTLGDASQDYTTTLKHTVASEDYGRQWKLGVKATSPDESVTDSSNVVTVAITPPTPTDVAFGTSTPTSLPVSWTPVEAAEGYQIKCAKLDADGNPVSATTYSVAASSLTPDADGKLCYEVLGLEPSTPYQVSVAAFTHGVTSDFSTALDAMTLAEPTIETPAFSQVPKTTWVEAGEAATFTAQASVSDGGTIAYAWQRKGAGEQDFAPLAAGDKYVMSEKDGVATLTVKNVGAGDVGAAFRCVATSTKENQTANAASAAAYLTVTPVAPTNAEARATSATAGEVTWTANGIVRRFVVTWQQTDGNGSKGSEYSRIVTISDVAAQGSCQLDGLLPGASYGVTVYAAPQAGFRSEAANASLDTPLASTLETATVNPDKQLVEPGETVTFEVATNEVDSSEQLEYRWQRNAFGESWFDVDGEDGAKKTLSVTAPEGGSVDGYRCVVTSTRTTPGVGTDTKSVTSSVGLLLTSVPVAPPVQLAAEPGTTSVHLTWASDDPRDVTYQVQYAEGPTPSDDAWQTVDNVGSSTSCDVEGLKANTVYSWRVQAVVRDQLQSEWASADTFTTLEEPSALAAVSVTPRWGVAVAGSDKDIAYTATTNIDNALNGETLSYQWQESATGDEWGDVPGATGATYVADTADAAPRSCQYRCAVTASKNGEELKTITSESVSFETTVEPPTSLLAQNITAATADLSWTGSLVEGMSYRVFWRASGTDEWASTSDLAEATYTLNSLMPATTYEWYVKVMDHGEPSVRSATSLFVTQSLSPIPQLTRVVVGPADQTSSATGQARFTAYTNVDDMPDATRAYTWEKRDLGSDPANPGAWTTLAGKTTREIELDPGAAGYVRCTVTYTPPAGGLVPPLANATVTSTNEGRVRVMPAAPADLKAADFGQTTAKVSWTGDANGAASDLVYRVVGSSEWIVQSGLNSASANLNDLKPGATYEWNVRSVAYGTSSDPLCSDWVAGPLFTTDPEEIVFSRAWVTPSATSVLAGADRAVTLTANTDADADHEQLTYQWQRSDGSEWKSVEGAKAATLQVSAKDLSVGGHVYRCEVTATRGSLAKTFDSNESVVTAMPAAPTDLTVDDDFPYVDPDKPSGQVKATLSWTWGNGALPEGARFEVSYRKLAGAGAINDEWLSAGLAIDNATRTCRAVLEARNITYQWRVRVVQNGVTSPWSEIDTFITAQDEPSGVLSSVQVTPSDSLVNETTAVTLTASTNVTDDSALTYTWEWCELTTEDPRKSETVWTPMDGKASKEITLSGDERNRYVRCTVTQTVDGTTKTVSSNPARVRTEPMAPKDTSAKAARVGTYDSTSCASLSWKCDDPRAKDNAQKTVIGYEVNYRKVGESEWSEKICNETNCPLTSQVLELDATYEWRVRTILSNNMKGEGGYNPTVDKGGPHSEWVDGPVFTMPKVEVTPTRAAAVIGNGRTLTFTAMPNAPITSSTREKTYQWERYEGKDWVSVPGATSETLSIEANKAATAGASRYRCMVTLGDGEYSRVDTTSNEVTCTLAPAAPANLTASDITSGEATLSWTWEKGGLQKADEFKVLYRESGAKEWKTATAAGGACELVLKDLKPETIYEWRVRAVQNDVESLPSSSSLFVTASEHPALKLESVLVDPSDQTVKPEAQATVTATTNLDGMVDPGELTYAWEKRALDSKPNDPNAWVEITGQTGSSVTSSVITSGYVRCTVTYTVNGSAVGDPVVSNEVSVRVQPGADAVPTGLEVKDIGDTAATLAWDGTLPTGGSFTLLYRPAGEDGWTTVSKLTASPYTVEGLAPGTTYEWRMCSVSADGVASEWVDGPAFATTSPDGVLGSVVVAPERAEAVAGDSALVEDFFATVTGAAEGQSLAYQWQVLLSGGWTNLPGETGERTHLSVATLEAGEHSVRCLVTATAPGGKTKTVESNAVTLVLSPATPSGLDVREVTRDAATLAWTWTGPGAVESFNVQYREEGASEWQLADAAAIDAVNMTCPLSGLAPGTSYEWQVQAVQGGQASEWAGSGFVTLSGGSLKVARIWPPDVVLGKGEQAKFTVFTNLGDAEGVSYEWQRRALDSDDADGSWETIPNATDKVLTLAANTTGYVRCVATQTAPSAGAAEGAEVSEVAEVAEAAETPETPEGADVADVAEAGASNETLGVNDGPEASETPAVNEAGEASATSEVSEVAETFAAPAPVAISNQARVRVTPSVPSGLAVGAVGYTNAALSWAAADVDGVTFTLAYHVAGSQDWTEVAGLTEPSYDLGGLEPGTLYEWRVQAVVGEGDDALKTAWAYGDSFTTQTMKTYQVTAGANSTWKPGQAGLAFTINGDLDKFVSLAVDGAQLVRGKDYTAASGSTILTLSSDYLATLSAGTHTLVATYTDGTAETTFTVAAADPGPGPDDPKPDKPTPTPPNDGNNGNNGGNGGTGATDGAAGAKPLAPTGDPLGNAVGTAGVLGAVCTAFAAIAAVRLRRRR
ncbi:fibronectin type III domain-containing protein [Gordonibacter urolithinfaciens]|uniref:fibronectin type III domain-containing protein n=1 Tax=Gordonibacter urolithinfaciens TaxID=1335613 RepID=UPI001D0606A8|nr:fibronectin type III domain-containing protein [Gordonibacter urolithinfaciens]MCB6561643.1 fibronectin type III domain-containing protein [Gordonibacter urolithinfaciens]MCB7085638.1 fibronectin type III domain-containing protein [Gordonibacter urolithinfaciens]